MGDVLWRTLTADGTSGHGEKPGDATSYQAPQEVLEMAEGKSDACPDTVTELQHLIEAQHERQRTAKPFLAALSIIGFRFCCTEKGYFGLGPKAAQPGDVIAVFMRYFDI